MEITGRDIRRIRFDLDLNQSDFARLLGYKSKERICTFERGHFLIPRTTQLLVHSLDTVPGVQRELMRLADLPFTDLPLYYNEGENV